MMLIACFEEVGERRAGDSISEPAFL